MNLKRSYSKAFPKETNILQTQNKKFKNFDDHWLKCVFKRPPTRGEIASVSKNPHLFYRSLTKAKRTGSILGAKQIDDIFRACVILDIYRDYYGQLARQNPDKTTYIKKHVYKLPFSLIIRSESTIDFRIYLHFKKFLGIGSTKTVFNGFDLINERSVAIGDLECVYASREEAFDKTKDYDLFSVETLRNKYLWQKQMNEALALCFHKNTKKGRRRAKIVMPLASEGTLASFQPKLAGLLDEIKQQLFIDIIQRVNEVHKKLNIVIADITPYNFLVDGDVSIHLRDFSHSFEEHDVDKMHRQTRLDFEAPEQRESESPLPNVTKKTDVYQVALTLWDIFVDTAAGDFESTDFTSDDAYDPDKYSTFWKMKWYHYPEGSLQRLLLEMLHPHPDKRPTLDEVIKRQPKLSSIHICTDSCDQSHKLENSA